MTTEQFFSTIGWGLLRQQKSAVLGMLYPESNTNLSQTEVDALEGVVALLDAIQDYATDELGMSTFEIYGDEEYFNLEDDEKTY